MSAENSNCGNLHYEKMYLTLTGTVTDSIEALRESCVLIQNVQETMNKMIFGIENIAVILEKGQQRAEEILADCPD
ncbi:MAG: hypothetical protein FWG36_07375 [Oscillospiraceae bacterium]|nr:hypothetical protein [Oscillospiraceae bacterium]